MKKLIALSFAFLLFTSTACKSDKYIPPQDEAGKKCIQLLDREKSNCNIKAQRDYKFCKDNKRKKCKLKLQVCTDQYKKGYVSCGGQVTKG